MNSEILYSKETELEVVPALLEVCSIGLAPTFRSRTEVYPRSYYLKRVLRGTRKQFVRVIN